MLGTSILSHFESLKLVGLGEDLLDVSKLQDYILKHKISILWITAPLLNQLCEENPHMFSTVRCLLTGGDILSPKHINLIKTANPDLTIINGYGPTENTTFSCCYTINKKFIPVKVEYILSGEEKNLMNLKKTLTGIRVKRYCSMVISETAKELSPENLQKNIRAIIPAAYSI